MSCTFDAKLNLHISPHPTEREIERTHLRFPELDVKADLTFLDMNSDQWKWAHNPFISDWRGEDPNEKGKVRKFVGFEFFHIVDQWVGQSTV